MLFNLLLFHTLAPNAYYYADLIELHCMLERGSKPQTFGDSYPHGLYLLRSIKVGTLDWARPFPADASSTSVP